jgi:hypothetical protein
MISEANQEVVYAELEDERTGEIIPVKPAPPASNTLATTLDLTKVGTLAVDEKAETVLAEPLNPEDVKIRPDGLVYLPWTWYAERLNRAFGRLNWGLVPQAGPQSKDMGGDMILVVWGHWLVIRGVPVGFEIGETAYRPSNKKMSFGDAAAGAKSSSLARNCKMLGMSLEMWDGDWVNVWRKKYAETYENNGRTEWRKKSVLRREIHEQAKAVVEGEKSVEQTAQVTDEAPKKHTVKSLREFNAVKRIAELSGKKNSEVAAAIGTLDEKSKYTIEEVVAILSGEGVPS